MTLDNEKQQQIAGSSTAYVSSSSTRSLSINDTAVLVNSNQHTMDPHPQAQPVGVINATPTQKKPKSVRIAVLFVFYVLNMCLGASLWFVRVPVGVVKTTWFFAGLDIRLVNFTIPYLRTRQPSIELSPRLSTGIGPAVARMFTYFETLKLLTALMSFIACCGTLGTIHIAIVSNGTVTGISGVHASFAENPEKYLLYVLLHFIIGCLDVLRATPRSVKATKAFCGLCDSDRAEAVLSAV